MAITLSEEGLIVLQADGEVVGYITPRGIIAFPRPGSEKNSTLTTVHRDGPVNQRIASSGDHFAITPKRVQYFEGREKK